MKAGDIITFNNITVFNTTKKRARIHATHIHEDLFVVSEVLPNNASIRLVGDDRGVYNLVEFCLADSNKIELGEVIDELVRDFEVDYIEDSGVNKNLVTMYKYTDKEKQSDGTIRPSYYGGKDNPYEVFKVLRAWGLDKNFFLGNVIKYVARVGKKNIATQIEELEKALTYLQNELQHLKDEQVRPDEEI